MGVGPIESSIIIWLPLCYLPSDFTVEDADGDTVRCRWAQSQLGECGGVCGAFPAVLDEVG